MGNTQFARISEDDWIFTDKIDPKRRQSLLCSLSFEEIIEQIANSMRFLYIKREPMNDYPGYTRPNIMIEVAPKLVDLFHNSSCGYRAQFYHSATHGESANRFAINSLLPKITNELCGHSNWNCPLDFAEKSLSHKYAKIWIHQGKWLLLKPKASRGLEVVRWVQRDTYDKKDKTKRIWSTLTPESETRLDIMGAWIKMDGTFLRDHPKPNRSEEINVCGYS
jgi:hypothetical protein